MVSLKLRHWGTVKHPLVMFRLLPTVMGFCHLSGHCGFQERVSMALLLLPPFPSSSIDENETTMFTCLEVFKANDPFLQIEKSCFGTCQLDVAVRDSLTLF